MKMFTNDILYDAVVVPSKGGKHAVRARIIGLSDELNDNEQPWVQPAVSTTARPPVPGTYLKVYMKNGDISFPVYLLQGISDGDYLPGEYIDDYPNVTKTDMGMYYLYNAVTNEYTEYDTVTTYKRTILADGSTEITTAGGYGFGEENVREGNARVMTENVVNIATGRPMAQGSSAMKVPAFNDPPVAPSEGTASQ